MCVCVNVYVLVCMCNVCIYVGMCKFVSVRMNLEIRVGTLHVHTCKTRVYIHIQYLDDKQTAVQETSCKVYMPIYIYIYICICIHIECTCVQISDTKSSLGTWETPYMHVHTCIPRLSSTHSLSQFLSYTCIHIYIHKLCLKHGQTSSYFPK